MLDLLRTNRELRWVFCAQVVSFLGDWFVFVALAGYINDAVPRERLDAVVDDIVARLLLRSSYALAWTKRTINRRLADQLNMTLDASAAYEMVNFLQLDRLGGNDPLTLDGSG